VAAGRYALAGAVVILPLLATLAGARAIWHTTVVAAQQDLSDRASLALANAVRFTETETIILRETMHALGNREDVELARDQARLHADLHRLAAGLPQLWDVYIWGRDGTVLASAERYPVPYSNVADRGYFRAVAAGAPDPYVSDLLVGRLDNAVFFNITVARRSADGAFAGLCGLSLNPASFESSYLETGLADPADGRGAALLRADGTILARAPAILGEPGGIWPGFPVATRDGGARYPGPPGTHIWGVVLRRVPGVPLYVMASISNAWLQARWWGDFQFYLWFAVAATAVMLALVIQVLRGAAAAERAAAEAALRVDALARSEARARALFINSPDLRTIVQETADGRFVFLDVNDTLLRTFGWRHEDVIGKSPADFYPPAVADEVQARMRECLRLGQPVTYEARRIANGQIRHFETTLIAVSDPSGGAPGARLLVTNARDVTERRSMEAHLRETQRLETLSQLAGGLAHDFNNILTVVSGQLERLGLWLDRHVVDEQPRGYLHHAATGLERGASLVRRMLLFARREEARPQALDLARLLADLVEFVRVTVGSGIEVVAELPPSGLSLPVHADATQIELAVVNLALNARDAMPSGGRLTLAAAERGLVTGEPDLPAGRYAVLEVRDTGQGMDDATLARAPEPFFTTKAAGKGTGLGLAMVRGLAVQTGGALRLHSRPGAGTTVALWLPIAGRGDPAGMATRAIAGDGTGVAGR
jgi:PAS domain S-box-containing protein